MPDLRRHHAIGMNADTDWANRTTNFGSVGHANLTLCGWHKRTSSGVVFADVADAAIAGVSHGSNGRFIRLGFNSNGADINDPQLVVSDFIAATVFAATPPFDVWVFYIMRSGVAGGTLTFEWSQEGSSTWNTQTQTNNVEGSVQGEQVLIGRGEVGNANTSRGDYAYWHAYESDIGQAASRALKTASTPQNSPWGMWPLDDNTDTADDSGNGRTLTFNGSMTSETSPVLATQKRFMLVRA